jgi:endonuclease/exonuclease/phosphatase (EEP) superfamily protein YafD
LQAIPTLASARSRAQLGLAAAARALAGLAAAALLVLSAYGLLAAWLWTAELATSLRPHLLMASLLLLATAGFCRARAAGLLALLALGVNALVMAWTVDPANSVEAGTRIRVLSLNVRYGNRDPQPVIDLLRRVNADVVVLAEAAGNWRGRLRTLRDLYPASPLDHVQGGGGILVLSRLPVQQIELVRITLGRQGRSWPTLAIDLGVEADRKVRVYAAHPMGPMHPESWRQRNTYLAALGRRIAEEPGPVILAGDLNTTPWSPTLRQLLSTAGLKDASGGGWPTPTWRPLPLRRLTWLGIPIDHVLASAELGVEGFERLPDVGSDHLPVLATLVVPEGSG